MPSSRVGSLALLFRTPSVARLVPAADNQRQACPVRALGGLLVEAGLSLGRGVPHAGPRARFSLCPYECKKQRQKKERGRLKSAPTRDRSAAISYYDASLISSRARFSADFACVRELTPGFSTWIALDRSMALSFDGAAHDLMSPAGFAPVTSHLRQLNLIERLWLT